MSHVALRPTDGVGSRAPSCVYSFLVEVDASGLAYERVVFDLAVDGIALHSLEDDPDHWRLVASVRDQAAMDTARTVLEAYFGRRLRRCVDRVVAAHRGGKIRTVATVPLTTALRSATRCEWSARTSGRPGSWSAAPERPGPR